MASASLHAAYFHQHADHAGRAPPSEAASSSSASSCTEASSGAASSRGKRAGLILVDLQNDFCPGGALAVAEGDKVVPVANEMRKAKDWAAVVLTQDWHPPTHTSFAANHPGKKPFETTTLTDPEVTEQVMWPNHCVQSTSGAEFHSALVRDEARDVVVRKGTDARVDSYSGFGDAFKGRYEKTQLATILTQRGITDVVVAGLATDYCVAYTASDAKKNGFNVTVVLDGCRGIAQDTIDAQIKALKGMGVNVVQTVKDMLETV